MNNHTNPTIEEFITSIQIKDRISKLAKCIESDHQSQKLIVLIVLKGSICFAADLLREIDLDVQIEFIHLSSYKGGVSTDIEMKSISSKNFSGERIIIIEDIVDTGKTINYISEYLAPFNPKSIQVCCLLNKKSRRQIPIQIDYNGFDIEDLFVVGYGMDFNNRFRNLPFIGIPS